MAVNKIYKFVRIGDMTAFLNGAIVGGTFNKAQGGGSPLVGGLGLQGLVGTTLLFTSPTTATVTFAASNGSGGSATSPGTNPDPYTLLFKDIKAQVEAAIPAVLVTTDADQHLVLVEASPSAGVALDAGGTANGILGFDSGNPTVGRLYTPVAVSAAPPCWVWAYSGDENMHAVYTWE